MSKPQSQAKIETKVNEQMEKLFLRSNTSQLQLLSKISSKLVHSEIVYIQKFTRPKKLIIPESKSPIILNEALPQRHSLPEITKEPKFTRSNFSKLTGSPKLAKPLELISSTLTSPTHSPTEDLLDKYNKLFKCTSQSPKNGKVNVRKTKKTIKNLCKKIKVIGNDVLSSGVREKIEVKMFAKNHEKKYLKEAIRELNDMKVANSMVDAKILKYSIFNSSIRK